MFRTIEFVGRRFALALLLVAVIACSSHADEVIIQEGRGVGEIECGDYACSPCLSKLGSAVAMRSDFDQNTIEMTAGELWQFFDKQGYRSVNKLALFLDVDRLSSDTSFNLSKLNIQIQSPESSQLLLTDANLGADGLIVPGYETSASRPEAQLKFDLGYDFMELFSSDSTEIVRVSIDSPISEASAPTFFLTADDNVFGRTNVGNMFFFVLFWGIVFLIVLRWMKPVRAAAPVRRTKSGGIAIAARRSA
jgi:hypothetical protein